MNVSDFRILQVIYLILENTKLERHQMSPFQFRRLIIEALQSRRFTVNVMSGFQRMFVVNSFVMKDFEEVAADADNTLFDKDDAPVETPVETPSPADQKSAWIQYQAYEVVSSGRASAYYFFDLRNEMALGNYDWQSDEFLYFYMKYFPGMTIDQLRLLRTQAVPWLTEPNTCNTQYQIIMQDSFDHRYVMIAYTWLERAANFAPVTRVQAVFTACRTFFYPQEQQELWNRLNYDANL